MLKCPPAVLRGSSPASRQIEVNYVNSDWWTRRASVAVKGSGSHLVDRLDGMLDPTSGLPWSQAVARSEALRHAQPTLGGPR